MAVGPELIGSGTGGDTPGRVTVTGSRQVVAVAVDQGRLHVGGVDEGETTQKLQLGPPRLPHGHRVCPVR